MLEWLDIEGENPGIEGATNEENAKSEYQLLSNPQLPQIMHHRLQGA